MGNSVFSYNLIYQKENRKDADVGIYLFQRFLDMTFHLYVYKTIVRKCQNALDIFSVV